MSLKRKAAVLGATGLLLAGIPGTALASSHREAPMIAKDPSADVTDLFAFVSPDKKDTVTLIADYYPFQEPNGGPNFYPFDDTVSYWIKIDNTGDAVEDITYEFRFKTTVGNENTFLYNTNTVTGADYKNLNVRQTYSILKNGDEIASDLPVPPANVGPRSTPKYGDLANSAISQVGDGMKAFAGQRDDPFFVDVGSIFDLGGLRPFNMFHIAPLPATPGVDSLGSFNVNSIALQVPMEQLTSDGKPVADMKADNATIGIWAGSSRQATTVLSTENGAQPSGDFVQVSRLGNPLINEVVVPLGLKDFWNRSQPKDDSQFAAAGLKPELAALINLLYPATANVDETNRTDLALILFQGIPGVNRVANTPDDKTPIADMLRLNMGVAPAKSPSRLGAIGGDLAGYPNGRRLWDDVTDIEIRAVAQGYGDFLAGALKLPNKSPNNTLGDGCDANDVPFLTQFPYVANPHQGYLHAVHHRSPCEPLSPTDTLSGASVSSGATHMVATRSWAS